MTLKYYDLETIVDDMKEIVEKAEKRCNELKREHESERSIGYQILEDYFYNVKKILEDNRKYLTTNLNDIPNLDIKDTNIFYKMLNR